MERGGDGEGRKERKRKREIDRGEGWEEGEVRREVM